MSIGNPAARALSAALLLVMAIPTAADAEPREVGGGTTVLAMSGLAVDLPAPPAGRAYLVSSSYTLSADGFDGRDVIDESQGEDLVAGNWVSVGYFMAGDPAAVVAGVDLADAWTAQAELWGATWSVRGGTFTFEGVLGEQPALVACIQPGAGKALVLHRYFLGRPTTMTQAEMLADFAMAEVPRAVWAAYHGQRTGDVLPTRQPEVRNRGDMAPSRWVYLENAMLEVSIPDDGYVWLVRSDPEQGVEFFDRMAPALPEVNFEVASLGADDCGAAFASIGFEQRDVPARNLPAGWSPGPQLVIDGELELTACHATMAGVLLVGVFQDALGDDVGYLAPMLQAIAEAADVP